jgi:hypothetical protein
MADQLNRLLKLNIPVREDQVILNYTPTKNIVDWGSTNVLIVGRENRFKKILPLEHIPKYVTIEEYCTMFPAHVPLARRQMDENTIKIKKKV